MSIIHGSGTGRFDGDGFTAGVNPQPDRYERHLKNKYGLVPEVYAAMVERQGGRCAICRRTVRLHVDHDHATGAVRGLLCRRCNLTLGYVEDDPDLLLLAADYLKAAKALRP